MATVRLNEYNTAAATETTGIVSLDFVSADEAEAVSSENGIQINPSATVYSYEKWIKLEVTDMGTDSSVGNIKIWVSGNSPRGDDVIRTNAVIAGYSAATFATPINTVSTAATQTLPSSSPASANIGIGGSLSGTITDISVLSKSDYIVLQLAVNKNTRTGVLTTLRIEYDETP